MHWDPSPWSLIERVERTGKFTVTFQATINAADKIWEFTTTDRRPGSLRRIFGVWLLSQVPDEGLNEALEGLHEVIDYYYGAPGRAPIATVVQGSGEIVSSSIRPNLIVAE